MSRPVQVGELLPEVLASFGNPLPPAIWLAALLEQAGSGRVGSLRQCPAHADPTPSLSIRRMPDGGASVKCFAGCDTGRILAALRLTRAALREAPRWAPASHPARVGLALAFPPLQLPARAGPSADPAWRLEATHPYGDHWQLLRWRHPSGKKDMRWETRDDAGAWIPGLRGVPTTGLPLYRDGEARMAIAAGEPLHLVESESSADALAASGRYATTWAGGAASPPLDLLAATLAGAHLVLIPDADEAGRRCADRILAAITPTAASVTVLWPAEGEDARDLLAAGGIP